MSLNRILLRVCDLTLTQGSSSGLGHLKALGPARSSKPGPIGTSRLCCCEPVTTLFHANMVFETRRFFMDDPSLPMITVFQQIPGFGSGSI